MAKQIYIALLFLSSVFCHQKDEECFSDNLVLSEPPSTQYRDQAILDIKHVYNSGGIDDVKMEKRITLDKGETKTITMYAKGYSKFNPRELFLHNNGGTVMAAMGVMVYYYNSVLVESSTTWLCWNTTLAPGGFDLETFSTRQDYRHGEFTFLRDNVEISRVRDDEIVGEEQDKQCWDMLGVETNGETSKLVSVNITHLRITSSNAGSWTTVKENKTVILQEGVKKVLQFEYSSHIDTWFEDHNPRNLTLLFKDSLVYAAMAGQITSATYDSYNHRWIYRDSWKCNETSLVIPVGKSETFQLPFFQHTQVGNLFTRFKDTLELSLSSTGFPT